MKFSIRVFFHLKAEDPYLAVKRAARSVAEEFPNGTVVMEGVDTALNGLFAPLEPGVKEVMVGFNVEAANMETARQTADRLHRNLVRQLSDAFISLPKTEDRITVEAC